MKETENLKPNREDLFKRLERLLSTCETKFNKKKASNTTRQRWARLIIQAVQAYGKLLDNADLEDLLKRLEKLESEVKK